MSPRRRPIVDPVADLPLILAALAALWSLALLGGGVETGLLYLAPAFLLAIPLLLGRYPGERVLVGLATRGRRRRPVVLAAAARPVTRRSIRRAGRLVGASPGGRAPPSIAQVAT